LADGYKVLKKKLFIVMADEKKEDKNKSFPKKIALIIGLPVLIVGAYFIGEMQTNEVIKKCNEGNRKACRELVEDLPTSAEKALEQSKITNSYFLWLMEKKNNSKSENQERIEKLTKLNTCKNLIKQNLKDPDSFKQLNSLIEQFDTGIVKYSATNSFGGRIQSAIDCNK
tara:strand:+ start:66 stop:575 length:510 start_codon:yes stop_codon:yes gene_type:complete